MCNFCIAQECRYDKRIHELLKCVSKTVSQNRGEKKIRTWKNFLSERTNIENETVQRIFKGNERFYNWRGIKWDCASVSSNTGHITDSYAVCIIKYSMTFNHSQCLRVNSLENESKQCSLWLVSKSVHCGECLNSVHCG